MVGSSSPGWFSYSPVDPASLDRLSAEQRALIGDQASYVGQEPVGDVRVIVQDLGAGQSEVRVQCGPGVDESTLIRAVIRELEGALVVFDSAGGSDRPDHSPK